MPNQRVAPGFPALIALLLVNALAGGCTSDRAPPQVNDQSTTGLREIVYRVDLGPFRQFVTSAEKGASLEGGELVLDETLISSLFNSADEGNQAAREALLGVYLQLPKDSDLRPQIFDKACSYASSGDLGESWLACFAGSLRSSDALKRERVIALFEQAAGFLPLSAISPPEDPASECQTRPVACSFAEPPLSNFHGMFRRLAWADAYGQSLGGFRYELDKEARAELESFLTLEMDPGYAPLLRAWLSSAVAIKHSLTTQGHAAKIDSVMRRLSSRIDENLAELRSLDDPGFEVFSHLVECVAGDVWRCAAALSPDADPRAPFFMHNLFPFEERCASNQSRIRGFTSGQGANLALAYGNDIVCLWNGTDGRLDRDLALRLTRLRFIAGTDPFADFRDRSSALGADEMLATMFAFEESPQLFPRASLFLLNVAESDPILVDIHWKRKAPTRAELSNLLGAEAASVARERADAWKRAIPHFKDSQMDRELIAFLDFLEYVNIAIPGTSTLPAESKTSAKTGTGFYVTPDVILTNAHVVAGCRDVRIGQLPVSVVAEDASSDLALLRGTEQDAYLVLGGAIAEKGASVTALGFPLGEAGARQVTVTKGNVAALAGPAGDSRFIQFTAPVQPGSSGGPLITDDDEVVGVVTSTFSGRAAGLGDSFVPQNVNYAVRSEVALGFLRAHGVESKRGMFDFISRTPPERSVVFIECK